MRMSVAFISATISAFEAHSFWSMVTRIAAAAKICRFRDISLDRQPDFEQLSLTR
jgi:hypothetical protein